MTYKSKSYYICNYENTIGIYTVSSAVFAQNKIWLAMIPLQLGKQRYL